MRAKLLYSQRVEFGEGLFAELVIWQVPVSLRGSAHSYKYRLAFVADDVCVLRYDNEAGKGDHKHIGPTELPYRFVDLGTLRRDFHADVMRWIDENHTD